MPWLWYGYHYDDWVILVMRQSHEQLSKVYTLALRPIQPRNTYLPVSSSQDSSITNMWPLPNSHECNGTPWCANRWSEFWKFVANPIPPPWWSSTQFSIDKFLQVSCSCYCCFAKPVFQVSPLSIATSVFFACISNIVPVNLTKFDLGATDFD